MNRQEWLEWRRDGIGSSDAAAIMGISPWRTLYQLWEEKVYGLPVEEESYAMTRGKEMEEPARKTFEELMNVNVFPKNVEHAAIPWARASLDGIDLDGKVLVEIKCPGKEDHQLAVLGKVPDKYYPQCQHQLFVTGLQKMYYFSFDGQRGIVVEVFRDEAYLEDLIVKENAFWLNVTTKNPPELTDADLLDYEDDLRWQINASVVLESDKVIKEAEKAKDDAKKVLREIANDRSAKGHGVKLLKSICLGRIDYDEAIKDYLENMRAHYPNVEFRDIPLEPYRKESFTKWTVRVMKE